MAPEVSWVSSLLPTSIKKPKLRMVIIINKKKWHCVEADFGVVDTYPYLRRRGRSGFL